MKTLGWEFRINLNPVPLMEAKLFKPGGIDSALAVAKVAQAFGKKKIKKQ